MGNFLRIVGSNEEEKRYYYKDTDEYIALHGELTKRQANELLKFAPRKDDDLDGGMRFLAKAFHDLVVGWSLVDDDGNPVAPSIEVYEQLPADVGTWVDRIIGEYIRTKLGNEADAAEEKPSDSLQITPKVLEA